MDIENVRRRYEEQLMKLPNVEAVGVGNDEAGKPVIKVLVRQKVAESDLRPEEVIPKTLEGWKIVVEESGVITAQTDIDQ